MRVELGTKSTDILPKTALLGKNMSNFNYDGITTTSPAYTKTMWGDESPEKGIERLVVNGAPKHGVKEISLPWYHEQMLPDNLDEEAADNATDNIDTEAIIDRQKQRIESLPKRDALKYIIRSDVSTENEERFVDFNYWHERSIDIDIESRKMLESIGKQIEGEVEDRVRRKAFLDNHIVEQQHNIRDVQRQNKILDKKVEVLRQKFIKARNETDKVREIRKLWKQKCDEERRNTRKEIYRSCAAELQLYRDRANVLSRPLWESTCIECCCCGTRCKNEEDCCYRCFLRAEAHTEEVRFRTHTVYGCWCCKVKYEFKKPHWISYQNDAYMMFRARTGFGKASDIMN